MPRRKTTKLKTLGQDGKGRYFRNLGWLKSTSGKYSQKKFYLGHDEDFSLLAVARLELLWKQIAYLHTEALKYEFTPERDNYPPLSYGYQNYPRTEKPIWTELTLLIAEAIRQGEPVARIPVERVFVLSGLSEQIQTARNLGTPPITSDFNFGKPQFKESFPWTQFADPRLGFVPELDPGESINPVEECASWLNKVRQWFPVIHIEIENLRFNAKVDDELIARGHKLLEKGKQLSAEPLTNQKLHHAIDAYVEFVKKNTIDSDGETSEWGKTKTRQIEFVKTHSVNVDLSQLGGPTIDAVLLTLSQRPITKRSKHCAKSFVKSCNKEFKVFLNWLDGAQQYRWEWPDKYEYKPPKIAETPIEQKIVNKSRQRKIKTYNIQELTTIYEFASPIQRAYLVLCLNCGFANAELVTLLCDDIFLRQHHPDQDILNIDTSDHHSWIARQRTKTDVLGTWKLWPETIMAIEWWQEQRDQIEDRYRRNATRGAPPFEQSSKGMFFITSAGKPIAEKARRTGRIPNSWNSLLDRVQSDNKGFKRLSFKFLRKTGASFVRDLKTRELAKAYLSQGQPAGQRDDVEAYTNLPYQQLFDALDDVYFLLKPVWAAVDNPFPEGRKLGGKDNVSPAQIKKMTRLRNSGVSVAKIAGEMGLDKSTIYRRCTAN